MHTHASDISTAVHNLIHTREQWHGLIIDVKDPIKTAEIHKGLKGILEKCGCEEDAIAKGNMVYCKGPYSKNVIEDIRKYASSLELKKEPLIVHGQYGDFLGNDWLDKAINEQH